MATRGPKPESVDDYIAAFPPDIRSILEKIRVVVRSAAPEAGETISYAMPAYMQNGVLIYFAAFRKHIGLYPPVSGDAELMAAVAPFAGPKGNLQFPLDQPIPYDLIERIVGSRLRQNLAKKKRGTRNAHPSSTAN